MDVKKSKKSRLKLLLKAVIVLAVLGIIGTAAAIGISEYVKSSAADYITFENELDASADSLSDFGADCIIVLGCRVNDTTPSPMLGDRLARGTELYAMGTAPKLLMSGDHGRTDYDEVNAMKQYAIDRGIPSEDIFMDHAGFSTYETMYRAKAVFDVKKAIIVTQSYHLYRAVYIARQLGIEACGVASDRQTYINQRRYDLREILARDKDFFMTIFKPEPTYLGEVIPISGSGDLTNDKAFT